VQSGPVVPYLLVTGQNVLPGPPTKIQVTATGTVFPGPQIPCQAVAGTPLAGKPIPVR